MKLSTALATAHHLIGWSLLVLLVGIVFVSQAQAAEPWERWFGIAYIQDTSIKVATCSPQAGSVVECQSQIVRMLNDRAGNPTPSWYTVAQSHTDMSSTIGDKVTITLFNPVGSTNTIYDLYTVRIGEPSSYDLSISGAQQILTAALLLFAIAWGVRAAARLGTHHHD